MNGIVNGMKSKIFVAMSGGVDSSLSAMLLKEQGYEVVGVTMQVWPQSGCQSRTCCSLEAVEDARRVAAMIDIPHYVLNYRDLFAEKVIAYFCNDYLQGITPNPCVACNRHIKFEYLLKQVISLGARKLATGHYARIVCDPDSGKFSLYTGIDNSKDQSYFLCYMNQFQLAHTLFPLSAFRKEKVRELARKHGLQVADKPDSQELCFVTHGSYVDFLEEHMGVKARAGCIRLLNGQVVGQHQGIHRFTIGQRHGLNVALGYPVYVIRLDAQQNTVWVGEDSDLWAGKMLIDDFHYISGEEMQETQEVKIKIRSGAQAVNGIAIAISPDRVKIEFQHRQRAITPGQTAVLYRGEEVLGGGRIADSAEL
ncbi:MAG: tRNA 2-thiouridine(34) synthase MnmA [Syntrophomonadaceae bacterium]|nr:tRNA 2-thiouridine(34) synthase MnmA [Syntrophomonadaceae bacterium]